MRRFRWLLSLALVAAILAGGTQWFLRHHRPSLAVGQRYGIDVSHHQDTIRWQEVATDGIEFAYIKATEGGDWVDPQFIINWHGAKAAGLDVSAYHFFTECRSGKEQAANFLANVPLAEVDLPLAIDLEFAGACSDPMTPVELRTAVADFIDIVETETNSTMLVYLISDFDEEYALAASLVQPMWTRSLYRSPDEEWTVWQYSATAYVDGIVGGVDLNVDLGAP